MNVGTLCVCGMMLKNAQEFRNHYACEHEKAFRYKCKYDICPRMFNLKIEQTKHSYYCRKNPKKEKFKLLENLKIEGEPKVEDLDSKRTE